jgi:hypothetical protein
LFDALVANGRAFDANGFWLPVERFDEFSAVMPQPVTPEIPERLRKEWTREDAARELTRGRLDVLGPVTAQQLADDLNLSGSELIDGALLALEAEGRVLRGYFSPVTGADAPLEWCDRRLLARIHRYTLNRLRAEIEPVTAADFMRFLLHWQHMMPEEQVQGVDGLAGVIAQLDGYEVAADAWEKHVLPARVREYDASQIDTLCLSGRVSQRASMYGVDTAGRWALLGGDAAEGPDRVEPIARALLARYGVVFRSLLARESRLPPWRELVMVYRRLEARGEIRGGRFVTGFGGEQFAAADAVGRLRAVRKLEHTGALIALSGADPLNLVGILTQDARVSAIARNRVLFRDGVAIAALEGGEVRRLAASELSDDALRTAMMRRLVTPNPRPWLRTETPRERLMRSRAAANTETASKVH